MSGLFANRGQNQGRSFAVWRAGRRRAAEGLIDKLAAALAEHTDEADIAAGLGERLDPGGDVAACAARIGISYSYARTLLQRMQRELGDQAR